MIPLPEAFCQRIRSDERFGDELLQNLELPTPISVRKHVKKIAPFFSGEKVVEWCQSAVYLPERPSFTLDPNFHAGAYYPQEAGSMYLDCVLRTLELSAAPKILDLCAAPGGKSTLIASFLNGKGVLVANEVIRSRSFILAENCTKWGYSNVLVSNNDPQDFEEFPGFFDVIVVDAPCSGEGMFRKDQRSRNEWSEDNTHLCEVRQRRILMDVWPSLTEGGYLLYSTCTFNPAENEGNINWLLEQVSGELITLPLFQGMTSVAGNKGVYFIPGNTESEGFYCVAIRKSESSIRPKSKIKPIKLVESDFLLEWGTWSEDLQFMDQEGVVRALTEDALVVFNEIGSKLRWMKRGVSVAVAQKKGWQPEMEWALCVDAQFHSPLELDKQHALSYLQGNALHLDAKLGWNVLSFNGNMIGWAKNIGNRMNNAYPKEWRIRMKID
jgi:16S rRNA C967 or C1407 C5-methylase (RsmB/RsmF family)/NOL1/NOP2/fmu family ribosome biogenesis protein